MWRQRHPGRRRAGQLPRRLGRATLLITHELRGLDLLDEIVVLDQGRVVQRGTHQELICAGGAYRDMWSAQLRC